jgi:hypothetical protein
METRSIKESFAEEDRESLGFLNGGLELGKNRRKRF